MVVSASICLPRSSTKRCSHTAFCVAEFKATYWASQLLLVSCLTNWLCYFQSETHSLIFAIECQHPLPNLHHCGQTILVPLHDQKNSDHTSKFLWGISEHASSQPSDRYLVLTYTGIRLQLQQQYLVLLLLIHRSESQLPVSRSGHRRVITW